MDFTIPENSQRMIQVVRDFIRQEVYPLAQDFLNASFRDLLPVLREKRAKVKAMVLWAPHLPEVYAGQGLGLIDFAHIGEELSCSPLGHYLFEYLLAFSCERRHFCPSCHQKRVADFGERLCADVLKKVPHRHFIFSIPKIRRR